MQRTLVTGATGFLGRRTSESLAQAGNHLILTGRNATALKQVRDKIRSLYPQSVCNVLTHDLSTGIFPRELTAGDDAPSKVVHCASPVPGRTTGEGFESKKIGCQTDAITKGFCKLLEQSQKIKQIILVSSTSVYQIKDNGELTEEDPTTIENSGYAVSKLFAEQECRRVATKRPIGLTVLRPAQIFGPDEPHGRALSQMIFSACHGQLITLHNGGEDCRDFIFVDDVTTVIRLALENQITGTFNVGFGQQIKMRKVIETLSEVCPVPFPVDTMPQTRTATGAFANTDCLRIAFPSFKVTPLQASLRLCCRTILER